MKEIKTKEVSMVKEAKAVLTGHGTRAVTVKELAKIKTPKATETWKPTPHVEFPEMISDMVVKNGWKFIEPENPFTLTVTKDNAKLFGVTKIIIPGMVMDEDYQLAIGFRNSHDKTLARRIAVGANVIVCSNLMITGDIQVRRIHSINNSTLEAIEAAFEMIPKAAKQLFGWMDNLRTLKISTEAGVAFLADAVEAKALPIPDFMTARESFLKACEQNNPAIKYGNTLWAAYQAVTEQYRDRSLRTNQIFSQNLNKLVETRTGMDLGLKEITETIELAPGEFTVN